MVLVNLSKKINLKPIKAGKPISMPLSLVLAASGTFFLIFNIDPANTFSDIKLANNVVVSSSAVTVS